MDDVVEQTSALDGLTDKQKEVLALVADGMTSKEIARKLYISESAVNQRIEVVRQRLGGMPRTHIARLYRRMNTVVLTVPSSNSVTGNSIQLMSEGYDGQLSEPKGSQVSITPSQAQSQVGSHPFIEVFTNLASALDGPSGRWIRICILTGSLFLLVATIALLLDIVAGIRDLLQSFRF
ncbi:helix-turn-helix transcriptional regulator [Novosphingobium sp.]|uniref:helix-turn-helix domain-containing protein n=1 Tax=Novosphingobium sp. TaxID=1874826 RepID=UPI0025EA95F1|nr:helix-turn-helix transcriptional regulator [Novosphingobium sp.]